jgi:hypothetical protein
VNNDELMALAEKFFITNLENMPSLESDRFCSGNTDTITAGTRLTITFVAGEQWIVRLTRFYADAVVGLDYQWVINGQIYPMSEGGFYLGKPIARGSNIKLIIENPTASDEDVAYRIVGWGDLVSG